MEIVHLGRYLEVKNPSLHPFQELIRMKPVWLTHDMQMWDDPKNFAYAKN